MRAGDWPGYRHAQMDTAGNSRIAGCTLFLRVGWVPSDAPAPHTEEEPFRRNSRSASHSRTRTNGGMPARVPAKLFASSEEV
jgi:hypothetical protein